ncbi:thiamine ABC transporter ATP-binding protein [Jiella sp. M17.18]|uniref:thiamine ABC transporter ATP-binding protein n=1 Tax=Jiella sp. M17.18 TaxID=3234247 RepID=UPI0034DF6886
MRAPVDPGRTAALRLDDVRFAHDDLAMRFDLTVEEGEWLALIGPSGAGKSTLLDIAAGFVAPDAGRVWIGGADVTDAAPAERPLTMVFQENNLFAHLDVFRNVALGIAPNLRLDAKQRRAVSEALERVGLAGFEKRRPAEMSGGERQRVALARAFLRGRPLLLLDEPFAALGPALRREMLALIETLRRARTDAPMTVLMVTHHPEDAVGHADRVAFLENGEIVVEGATDDILSDRTNAGVARYLGTTSSDR